MKLSVSCLKSARLKQRRFIQFTTIGALAIVLSEVLRNAKQSTISELLLSAVITMVKETRRLAKHHFRRFERISVHATLAVPNLMAVALSKARLGQLHEV